MFDIFKNRLEITGTLWTVTAIRISVGRSTEPIGSDLPVIKDALGRPFIPGSSLKGAMRSRLESFLRGILGNNRHLVANPAVEEEWSIQAQEMKKLKEKHHNDIALTKEILEQTDLISHLFGSPWLASKLQIRDLTVLPDYWFGQYQERDGVAIDRDTETAADSKLYDYQVVPSGTPFLFKAIVENAKESELGLLMIGLHQLETEQIPLGGGRSRGLGVVKLDIEEMKWFDARKEQNPDQTDPEKLLDYLKNLVTNESNNSASYISVDQKTKNTWTETLINLLRNKLSSQNTTEHLANQGEKNVIQ